MIMVMLRGYLSSIRYFVQVFQSASGAGNSPWPSISDGPERSASIPQCGSAQGGRIRRGESTVAFNFRRPVAVSTHSPMRDVAVVADPVEELPAAGVVIPAPVFVQARGDVRLDRKSTRLNSSHLG